MRFRRPSRRSIRPLRFWLKPASWSRSGATGFTATSIQDSRRLAQSSKALVAYLDDSGPNEDRRGVPQEDAESFFAAHQYHFAGIESGRDTPDALVRDAPELKRAGQVTGRPLPPRRYFWSGDPIAAAA